MNLNCSNLNSKNNLSKYNRVSKLSAIFESQPELLYKNPYINFLREYRIRHLDLNIPELYHEAANAWIKLSDKEKKVFRCLDIIRDIKHRRAMKRKFELIKKRRQRKRKIFNPRRVMGRNKKRIFPITTIKRQQRPRQHKMAEKVDKENRSIKKSSQNAKRVRRILKRLKMINKTAKMRTPRRPRRRSSRLRRQRRQVKRRK